MPALAPVGGSSQRENQKGRGLLSPVKNLGKRMKSLDEERDMVSSPMGLNDLSRATETLMKSPAGLETPETSERCRVLMRLRPLPASDGGASPLVLSGNSVEVMSRDGTQVDDVASFPFDHLFPQDTTQSEVFAEVMNDSVASVLKGFNATVLAYGQTGAGKTHTMFGAADDAGIIPRALHELFARIAKDESGSSFVVKASMLEIYMEELKDLIRPGSGKLRLRESSFDGVWVEGLHHVFLPNAQAALSVVKAGFDARTTGSTNMNQHSSRSHCILTLRVEQQQTDGIIQRGELHFADLAGLERVDRTGAAGQTLEEAKRINTSLSALGNCIHALAQAGRSHIPFRDSKLTFLLKNSLGGNAKTTLLVAASPRWRDLDETLSTLKFGARARNIRNLVKVNRKLSAEELERLLNSLRQDHEALRKHCRELERRLASSEDKENGSAPSPFPSTPSNGAFRSNSNPKSPGGKQTGDFEEDDGVDRTPSGGEGWIGRTPGKEEPAATLSAVCNRWRRAHDKEDIASPASSLDPLRLLQRIAELESANVDMQIELESLAMAQESASPTAVVRTSLSLSANPSLSLSGDGPAAPLDLSGSAHRSPSRATALRTSLSLSA
eukprot:CAMPEP_0180205504 /NCGR_PEP_ID=MMETSP0987-20121128/9028_1 /TAXON_ID=697907 /ORGANISM="non described non described, Strain CCMP2293" /LENGTH=612 /DNA_ID=CAMNT_0022161161 /DNA_START=61 /DNA_END=1894 /DNA_ORIENTATION=-